MDTAKQQTYRDKLVTHYEGRAFELLALYSFFGEKYKAHTKEVDEYKNRIKTAEDKIREIEALPDHHTVENRTKVKALKKDIEGYEGMVKKVEKPMQDLEKKIIGYQQEAVEMLEQGEFIRNFKMKTPAEVEADIDERRRKLESPAEPVVAGAEANE